MSEGVFLSNQADGKFTDRLGDACLKLASVLIVALFITGPIAIGLSAGLVFTKQPKVEPIREAIVEHAASKRWMGSESAKRVQRVQTGVQSDLRVGNGAIQPVGSLTTGSHQP